MSEKNLDRETRDRCLAELRIARHIVQIPFIVEETRLLQGSCATVMVCSYRDFRDRTTFDSTKSFVLDPNILGGSARVVFDYCKATNLRPTLEYNADTREFRIVIHF